MTVAVCFKCGAMKTGAFTSCEKCGCRPQSEDDFCMSLGLSDKEQDMPTLKWLSEQMQNGRRVEMDSDSLASTRQMIRSLPPEYRKAMFEGTLPSDMKKHLEKLGVQTDKASAGSSAVSKPWWKFW